MARSAESPLIRPDGQEPPHPASGHLLPHQGEGTSRTDRAATKRGWARWALAGAIVVAPVMGGLKLPPIQAFSVAGNLPWCCAVRVHLKQTPSLPGTTNAGENFSAVVNGKRYRRGRLRGMRRKSRPEATCHHCGAALGEHTYAEALAGAQRAFCSEACLQACRDYVSAGMGSLYALGIAPAAETARSAASDYAHPDVASAYVRAPEGEGGLAELTCLVSGMHCGDCIWLIERAVGRLPGVSEARVSLQTGRLRVRFDAAQTSLKAVLDAVGRAGYAARPADLSVVDGRVDGTRRLWLTRLGIAGFGTLATMFLAEPLYYAPVAGADALYGHLLRYLGLVVGTGTGLYAALPFLRGAWASLHRRVLGMDALIALGVLATYGASVAGFLNGGAVYFDSLLMFLFLLTAGRWAEAAAKGRVFDAVAGLLGRQTRTARRLEADGPQLVALASLRPGDRVLVAPGEVFPADGVVEAGQSQADESLLTGESRPVPKGVGASVEGGSVNGDGALTVRCLRVGEDAAFGRLERMVQEAETAQVPVQRLADAAGHWGALGVVLVAGATFAFYLAVDPSKAVTAATAVLIVTCPCALGLATPAALVLGVARALREGILFKRPEALEALAGVRHVVLDKTGTLTRGTPSVVGVLGAEAEVLGLAALLERGSTHPLARAIVEHAAARGLDVPAIPPEDSQTVVGCGVRATVAGKPALAGRADWLEAEGFVPPSEQLKAARVWMKAGRTLVWVAQGERVLGAIVLGDALRPDAEATLAALAAQGIGVTLLTGDNAGAAEAVAASLGGIAWIAEVRPEEKRAHVERLRAQHGCIAMVGDGLNDAPALAAADVGLALNRGADLAVIAADVVLPGERLEALASAIALSRRTLSVIHGNFALSGVYNAIVIPLAVAGLVTPLLAAILMPLSSLAVLAHTWRLRR